MKNHTIQPTDKNILDTFCTNSLGRNADVMYFVNILDSMEGSSTIALSGGWGSGKTFFIKQVKLLLDYGNENSILNPTDREKLKNYIEENSQFKDLQNHLLQTTFYYDAWENEGHEDPILSLIYTILVSETGLYEDGKLPVNKKNVFEAVFNYFTDNKFKGIIDSFKKTDILEDLKRDSNVSEKMTALFNELIQEQGNRLVFFVDELDRCTPSFAVRFLERINHYFSDERITFVFSVNLEQLQHTIKKYYGEGFDASRYLDKFFDFRVPLPAVETEMILQHVGLRSGSSEFFDIMCILTINWFSLSLREIERYVRSTQSVRNSIIRSKSSRYDNFAYFFGESFFVPILLALIITDNTKYEQFIKGESAELFSSIIMSGARMGRKYLAKAMLFPTGENSNPDLNTIRQRYIDVYNAFFSPNLNNTYNDEITIGLLSISKRCREDVLRTASMLSSDFGNT